MIFYKNMFLKKPFSLRTWLFIVFLLATSLTGLITSAVGIRIINSNTNDLLKREIKQNISTARLIYEYQLEKLTTQLQILSLKHPLQKAFLSRDADLHSVLGAILKDGIRTSEDIPGLDMLSVTDTSGKVLYSASNPGAYGNSLLWDPVIKRCLDNSSPVSGTILMSFESVCKENPGLVNRIRIPLVSTPHSINYPYSVLKDGLVLRAAFPIFDRDNNLLGALAGGVLINRDFSIVDRISETLYHHELYKGKDLGYATLFLGGVRVSTTVLTSEAKRAVGTIVSEEVYNKVIKTGKEWTGRRAFVVDNWYFSTYIPIRDPNNNIIGMIYTGILEEKFMDQQHRTIMIFLGITIAGVLFAFFLSYTLGHLIVKRLRILKEATEAIGSGNLAYQVKPDKTSGFNMLEEALNNMAKSLKERDERLQKAFIQITKAERLAAIGHMAAGVAHEINNPLGGILLYSSLVLEDLPQTDPNRSNIEKIIYQTNRCKGIVQELLSFSRAPQSEMIPLDINKIIMTTLDLIKVQPVFSEIEIIIDLGMDLPEIYGDRLRLEEVFINIFANASDAMKGTGRMTIRTRYTDNAFVRIWVADTGYGIDKSNLSHIFEPFYTTKDPGQGTGLGLSIVYSIIKNHNGIIEVESELGKGTTFIITLPVLPQGHKP
jgi:two-component system, NtrC family, sensor kinase